MKLALIALATAFIVGCGPKDDYGMQAPTGEQPQAQQHHDSGMSPLTAGALGAAAGYMMGRASAPTPQPQIVQQAPTYYPTPAQTQARRGWFDRLRDKPSQVAQGNALPKPSVAPPSVATSPKFAAPLPKATPTPSPSFSRPSTGYSSVTQSKPTYSSSFRSTTSSMSSSSRGGKR